MVVNSMAVGAENLPTVKTDLTNQNLSCQPLQLVMMLSRVLVLGARDQKITIGSKLDFMYVPATFRGPRSRSIDRYAPMHAQAGKQARQAGPPGFSR